MIGTALHLIGDQQAARSHLDQMLVRHVGTTTRSQRIRFFFDQRVMARVSLTHTLWLLGSPDHARRTAGLAVADARAAAHPASLCFALALYRLDSGFFSLRFRTIWAASRTP